MRESELKECTKSVLAFFREFHDKVDIIPSESVKFCDNNVSRLGPSRVHQKNLEKYVRKSDPQRLSVLEGARCCNSLILEGLFLDRFCEFLLVSPLISTILAQEFSGPPNQRQDCS